MSIAYYKYFFFKKNALNCVITIWLLVENSFINNSYEKKFKKKIFDSKLEDEQKL